MRSEKQQNSAMGF